GRIFNARLRSMAEYSMPGSAQWPNIQCPAPLNGRIFNARLRLIAKHSLKRYRSLSGAEMPIPQI
ncbi:MAG: hypothetical protein K9H49_16255, partial [Bacteroidales bacterium]|nr:hypothetical protein [Bacteroidales bacterium]